MGRQEDAGQRADQPVEKRRSGILNVVLHGMIGVVLSEESVELLIPQVDDHVFLAGTWRMERRLKENVTYGLRGVQSASWQSRTRDAIIGNSVVIAKVHQIDPTPDKMFCCIELPIPFHACSSRHVDGSKLIFTGTSRHKAEAAKSLGLIHVFRYHFDDVRHLRLGDELEWKPVLKDEVVKLHIFAEPL